MWEYWFTNKNRFLSTKFVFSLQVCPSLGSKFPNKNWEFTPKIVDPPIGNYQNLSFLILRRPLDKSDIIYLSNIRLITHTQGRVRCRDSAISHTNWTNKLLHPSYCQAPSPPPFSTACHVLVQVIIVINIGWKKSRHPFLSSATYVCQENWIWSTFNTRCISLCWNLYLF